MCESNQSQKHGFTWENDIRENIFGLPKQKNDRNVHDIPSEKNIYNDLENVSIKTTGSETICCGDIIRFYSYDFSKKNTVMVIKYKQSGDNKIIDHIYEIDYNQKCHEHLFGNLPKEEIVSYVNEVNKIPQNIKGKDAKAIFSYLEKKKELSKKYSFNISINPKVDSSQSRVQCSITKFIKTLKDFIIYKSPDENTNMVREKEISYSIISKKRARKSKN
jgi:hypothetical protein